MHVGHVGLRAETHGGWFVFADHQSGLPEHVIFKEQVRSTTMLPAIERVGGKTSSGDQQGGMIECPLLHGKTQRETDIDTEKD